MEPGQITKYPTKYGGKGIFEPGPWKVNYDPESRDLVIDIAVKHFYQDVGKGMVEGSIYYFIHGTVSSDWSQWEVDWFAQYNITAYAPEPTILEDMKEPQHRGIVVFEKVSSSDGR